MAGAADPGKMLMRSPVLAWPPSGGGVTTMSACTTSPFDRFHGERAAARSRGAQETGSALDDRQAVAGYPRTGHPNLHEVIARVRSPVGEVLAAARACGD